MTGATSLYYKFEDELYYQLENDTRNGLLDDPLRNGSRLGFRVIDPSGQPQYVEGWRLSGLVRMMGDSIIISEYAGLDWCRRHKLRPFSRWPDATKGGSERSPSPIRLTPAAKTIGTSWFNRPRGFSGPSRLPGKLRQASDAMINEAIRAVYDAAEASGTKPPNINELPAAVLLLLEQEGFTTSKSRIQQLGQAEEFTRRRRLPGKTLASERRKK